MQKIYSNKLYLLYFFIFFNIFSYKLCYGLKREIKIKNTYINQDSKKNTTIMFENKNWFFQKIESTIEPESTQYTQKKIHIPSSNQKQNIDNLILYRQYQFPKVLDNIKIQALVKEEEIQDIKCYNNTEKTSCSVTKKGPFEIQTEIIIYQEENPLPLFKKQGQTS